MKIPADLTPIEYINGVCSKQVGFFITYYEIPDKVYERFLEELKKLHEVANEKTNTQI